MGEPVGARAWSAPTRRWAPSRASVAVGVGLADIVVDMRGSFRGLGVWCRDRRTGSLGQILVQIDGWLLATFQTKLAERADEAVGDALPLLDQGHEVVTPTGPLHDETVLRHQDGIDVVEVELGAGRDFHQGALRRTGRRLTPEVVEQLGAPVEEVAGGQGSAVKDGQSPDLHLGLEGVQTGPGTDRSPSGTVRRGASSL
jgi:hypothetical protein